MKLFEDQDFGETVALGDSLLLPTAYASKEHMLSTGLEEDIEKLLRYLSQVYSVLVISEFYSSY